MRAAATGGLSPVEADRVLPERLASVIFPLAFSHI